MAIRPDGSVHARNKKPPASTDAGGLPIQNYFSSILAALLHNQTKGFGSCHLAGHLQQVQTWSDPRQ